MAMRLLTLHVPLPREQGSIVRLLELFSQHYAHSNPGLWDAKEQQGESGEDEAKDQVLVVCYSILMLNTDAWNANNKNKMTREQYVRNTSGLGVSEDILKVSSPNFGEWLVIIH